MIWPDGMDGCCEVELERIVYGQVFAHWIGRSLATSKETGRATAKAMAEDALTALREVRREAVREAKSKSKRGAGG